MFEPGQKDELTNFYLRKGLNTFLEDVIYDAATNKKSFSLLLLDLNHFKKYNDTLGHQFGDEILKHAANILVTSFAQDKCHFFRYGGDEFILVLPEKDEKEARGSAVQLAYNLDNQPLKFKNKILKITASCGISGYPSDGQTIETLIKKADEAMYFSKRHSRDRTYITLASAIKRITIRNMFAVILSILIILGSAFILYQFGIQQLDFQKLYKSLRHYVRTIIAERQGLDVVVLKNGSLIKGRILEETKDKVIMKVYVEKGTATMAMQKGDIDKIRRYLKTEAKSKQTTP